VSTPAGILGAILAALDVAVWVVTIGVVLGMGYLLKRLFFPKGE
jgi:hypothetical protein